MNKEKPKTNWKQDKCESIGHGSNSEGWRFVTDSSIILLLFRIAMHNNNTIIIIQRKRTNWNRIEIIVELLLI